MKKNVKILLISILVIMLACTSWYVGVKVYQSKSRVHGFNDYLEEIPVAHPNARIECFCGKIKEREVKFLIKKINTSNVNNIFPEFISIENKSDLLLNIEDDNYVITATQQQMDKYYKIDVEYSDKTNYINKVIISEAE